MHTLFIHDYILFQNLVTYISKYSIYYFVIRFKTVWQEESQSFTFEHKISKSNAEVSRHY